MMGAFSATAGLTYCMLKANFRPYLFLGKNMMVLAAVVLGGASVSGGRGSVLGVFLGTVLVGLVNQAMVYLGISTRWYDAVIGTIFIIYATFQSITNREKLK